MSEREKNTAHLTALFPELVTQVLDRYGPRDDFVVEPARSGSPTAVLGGVYLHSRHDPVREARRLVERRLPADGGTCVFLGLGLGYHVEAYLRYNPTGAAVIVEPDVPAFLSALSARDLTAAFPELRTSLLLGTSPFAVMQVLERLGARRVDVFSLRSVYERNAEYFDQVRSVIASYLSRREVNITTLKRFGKLWVRNLARNLGVATKARRVRDLEGRFEGLPALLVGAGPSLDQILPRLRQLQRRMIILAVDTSLRACLDAGVHPDFLVVVDPQYWNTRHLDWNDPGPCMLISESSTHPRVFRRLEGPVFFCSSLFPLGRYLERPLGTFGKLGAGGSVSTTAWDFARVIGASPIYCAGLDLGFPSKQTHYRGSFFEERVHTLSSRLAPTDAFAYAALTDADPYPVPANRGGTVLTDRRLVIYQWWFENQMRMHSECNTYNLSPGGVQIEGMGYTPAEELAALPDRRREIDRLVGQAMELRPASTGAPQIAGNVSRLVAELASLEEDAQRGMALAEELAVHDAPTGRRAAIIAELNALDHRILSSTSKDVAGFLLQPFVQELLDKPDGTDAAESSRRLYQELAASASFHRVELSRGLEGLSAFGQA